MNRQLSITLVTESEYKNDTDEYEIQTNLTCSSVVISMLIPGIGTSYLYFSQLKKCFHMYTWNTALFRPNYMALLKTEGYLRELNW